MLKKSLAASFLFGSVLLAKEMEEAEPLTTSNKIKTNKSIDESTLNQRLNFNFIADVVDETLPSIVHIEIKQQNAMFGTNAPSRYGSMMPID